MRVFVLGAIAVAGIIGIQAYWVYNTWDLNQVDFKQKVDLALFRTASALSKINEADLPARDIIKQRSSNYFIVNIDSEIDASMLEFFLRRELENLALNIDFEYAIYDCTSDQMVYGNYCRYSAEDSQQASPTYSLPKYSSEFNYYFGVKFPTRGGYLLGQMQLAIFFSVILLLTLAFFAYSVYVILRQKRLSEMQKDFINNMTHEFKTPLSTIRISTDVFLRSEPIQSNPRLARYARIISEQHQRLNSQVERVLQVARLDKGNLELNKDNIAIQDLLANVLDSERVRTAEVGGHVHSDLPETPIIVSADPFHVSNILHCLIDNAVKYSRSKPQVTIRGQLEQKGFRLTVQDQGVGIARDHQKRVFEKFYRVPTGNVHNVKGFGLGLYYVGQVCKAHGWPVTLESEPGEGTTIHIYMRPIQKHKANAS